MFVSAHFRGRESGVAARLLGRLLTEAREREISEIFLGTTEKFLAAHRFYEKHGFSRIQKDMLPNSFPLMVVDTQFYVFDLRAESRELSKRSRDVPQHSIDSKCHHG